MLGSIPLFTQWVGEVKGLGPQEPDPKADLQSRADIIDKQI